MKGYRKIFVVILIIALVSCCFSAFSLDGRLTFLPDEKTTYKVTGGTPEPLFFQEYIPLGTDEELVRHKNYSLGFNNKHKQADWVYYRLDLRNRPALAERTDNFREDRLVRSGSAKPSDYVKSGYDRGHLCPAGDMTGSQEAMSETFYMSNMSPQNPAFNRGIWKSLEEKVRSWGKKEVIYVVTGPVFKDDKGTIGRSRVTVPGYYYKLIYAPAKQRMVAFVLPNEKGKNPLPNYRIAVDSVENLTHIDFFSQLPDTLENRLEAAIGDFPF